MADVESLASPEAVDRQASLEEIVDRQASPEQIIDQ